MEGIGCTFKELHPPPSILVYFGLMKENWEELNFLHINCRRARPVEFTEEIKSSQHTTWQWGGGCYFRHSCFWSVCVFLKCITDHVSVWALGRVEF